MRNVFTIGLISPLAVSVLLCACGQSLGADSSNISIESIDNSKETLVDTNPSRILPNKPVVYTFSDAASLPSEGGSWLFRRVNYDVDLAEGHDQPGSLRVAGRRDAWHGPLLRLPPLQPVKAFNASVWVKPIETITTTEFSLVLTLLADGFSTRKVLNTVLVEPNRWHEVKGEFVSMPYKSEAIHTLHLEVPDTANQYFVDDVSISLVEMTKDLRSQLQQALTDRHSAKPISGGDQLIFNGGAEDGLQYWGHQGGSITRSKVQVHTGEYSILVSNRSQSWHAPTLPIYGLQDSVGYRFRVFARTVEGAAPTEMKLTMKRETLGQSSYITIASGYVTDVDWSEITGDFSASNISRSERVTVYVEALDPTVSFYVDSLSLEVLPP